MMMKGKIKANGPSALERALTFDEMDVLQKAAGYLRRTLNYERVEIESLAAGMDKAQQQLAQELKDGTHDPSGYNLAIIETSQPGSPAVCLPSLLPRIHISCADLFFSFPSITWLVCCVQPSFLKKTSLNYIISGLSLCGDRPSIVLCVSVCYHSSQFSYPFIFDQ
jgi:hypothetical protein